MGGEGRVTDKKWLIYGVLSVVALVVGLVLLGGGRKNELRMCASALLYMPYAASKEFYELERMGSPPNRERFREIVNAAEFQNRTKRCPKGGAIQVTISGQGSLMDEKNYSAQCRIHGTLDDLRKGLGEKDFERVRETVKTGAKFL